ncbi:MAG TPA: EamA family transporter [Thermoanaerobaculia bacterium]|nr:EamA family transporter [Thermoanaerobaculia bacterium]
MSIGTLPLLLIVGSSVSASGFDLSRKLASRHLRPLPMVFVLTAASVPLFAAAVAVSGGVRIVPAYFVPATASLLLNIAANLAFIQSVRIAPLSLTVPLLSLTPAFTTLLGFVVLGERPAGLAWLGIALVVGGAFTLHLTADSGRSAAAAPAGAPDAAAAAAGPDTAAVAPAAAAETAGARRRLAALLGHRGAWLMAATALLWSLTIPLDKLAIGRASAPFHGLFLTAGGALATFVILAARGQLGEVRGARPGWAPLLIALIASTLELGLQLAAIRVVLVSVVETVKRGLGNFLAVALGRLVFGEALTWGKAAAAAVMAAGVALILL